MSAVDPRTLTVTSDLAKRLREHVEFLASPALKGRQPGTPGNRAAAEYIVAQFRSAGLEPLPSLNGYGQTISPLLGDNLIGARPAAGSGRESQPQRWILIGAHYDHLGELGGRTYLGADDNASAVAVLLELARALPPLAHHSVLFVAFNAEEPPFIRTPIMGSQVFIDHLPAEIRSSSNLQAAVIMDLMGGVHWEPLRDVVFAVGAEKSPELYQRVKEAGNRRHEVAFPFPLYPSPLYPSPLAVLPVGIHLLEELPVIGRVSFSDYDAFRNASVPFLFLSAGRTPHYHHPSDLPDTLHYERMASTVRWLESLLHGLDQDTVPYRFEPDRLVLADEVETLRALVFPASQWKTRIPGTSPLSLLRLKLDARWLERLNPEIMPEGADRKKLLRRLERISFRLQCLLANFYGCGLI